MRWLVRIKFSLNLCHCRDSHYFFFTCTTIKVFFSPAQQLKLGPAWCSDKWWITPLDVLAMASAVVIYDVLHKFVEQFHPLKRNRKSNIAVSRGQLLNYI